MVLRDGGQTLIQEEFEAEVIGSYQKSAAAEVGSLVADVKVHLPHMWVMVY